jgi:adenylate cyclase
MKYRTRLLLFVTCVVLLSNAAVFVPSYLRARQLVLDELHSKATSVAASTAKMLNGDALSLIRSARDEDSVAYRTFQQKLRAIRDANRREDVQVEHIYTLMRSAGNPDELRFGVNSESSDKFPSHVGDVYTAGTNSGLSKHLDQAYAQPGFGADGYAPWVTGYAPVYDRNGKFVAAIGVGLSADQALASLNKFLLGGLALIPISLAAALLVARRFARGVSADETRFDKRTGRTEKEQSSDGLRRAA